MLEIINLHVTVASKEVLRGVNLAIQGKTHVLMGPNGAGKSTLLNAILGHPSYTITKGTIKLDGEDITNLNADEKAKRGLFLSFQNPVEIPGVRLSHFLRTIYNIHHETQLGVLQFKTFLDEKCKLLGIDPHFTKRFLNEGFSGGEKKRAEMLQLVVVEPKYALLDETDSGLDVDAIKLVANTVKKLQETTDMTIVVVTHYKRFIDLLKPEHVAVIDNGQIVMEGDAAIAQKIDKEGFTNE